MHLSVKSIQKYIWKDKINRSTRGTHVTTQRSDLCVTHIPVGRGGRTSYSHSHSAVHFFCDDWWLELCTSWILLTIIIMTKIGKRKGSMRYDLGSPEIIYIYLPFREAWIFRKCDAEINESWYTGFSQRLHA